MAKIKTVEETITPKWADDVLKRHYERVATGKYRQRHVYKSIVTKYVTDMRAGHFKQTPMPIVFDANNDLQNGQHRLEAVRQSGVTIKAMVSTGWPPETIDTIDRGKARTVADQLNLNGVHNSIQVAAAVAGIVRVCYSGASPSISYSSAIYVMDDLGFRKHIDHLMGISSPSKVGRSGRTVGPLAWYRSYNQKKADEFAQQMVDMNMVKGSGVALYSKYIRDRNPDSQDVAIRATCSAIMLWDNDTIQENLRPNVGAIDWMTSINPKAYKAITNLFGKIGASNK